MFLLMMTRTIPGFDSVRQASRITKYGPSRIADLIGRGLVPGAVKNCSGEWLIPHSEVKALKDRRLINSGLIRPKRRGRKIVPTPVEPDR